MWLSSTFPDSDADIRHDHNRNPIIGDLAIRIQRPHERHVHDAVPHTFFPTHDVSFRLISPFFVDHPAAEMEHVFTITTAGSRNFQRHHHSSGGNFRCYQTNRAEVDRLRDRVDTLETTVYVIVTYLRELPHRLGKSVSTASATHVAKHPATMTGPCYNHQCFGSAAKNCRSPCSTTAPVK